MRPSITIRARTTEEADCLLDALAPHDRARDGLAIRVWGRDLDRLVADVLAVAEDCLTLNRIASAVVDVAEHSYVVHARAA